MDLEVVMKSSECPYIVKFYGALFTEVCHQNIIIHAARNLNYFQNFVTLDKSGPMFLGI